MRHRVRAVMVLSLLMVFYVISPVAAWVSLVTLFGSAMWRQRQSFTTSRRGTPRSSFHDGEGLRVVPTMSNRADLDDDELGSVSEQWIARHRSSSFQM